MTKDQLKALTEYLDARIWEMVALYDRPGAKTRGHIARSIALKQVLKQFEISEEDWKQ